MVEKFGFLSFVTSIITYFLVFTDYGFNLTATRLVSINRSNNDKVSEIFSSVITLKMALFFASFIVLSLLMARRTRHLILGNCMVSTEIRI